MDPSLTQVKITYRERIRQPPLEEANENQDKNQILEIDKPSKFNKKSADKITNFNPSTDTLEIDTDSFGIDSSATFAAGKNKKDSQEETCQARL